MLIVTDILSNLQYLSHLVVIDFLSMLVSKNHPHVWGDK